MKFGRRKRDEVEVADAVADDAVIAGTTPEVDIATDADADLDEVDAVAPTDKSAPADRADNGPHDETEANLVRPYVDLGGVKVLPREGLHLRLEVEEGSQRVVAVGLDYDESTLQVQPFAAPRPPGCGTRSARRSPTRSSGRAAAWTRSTAPSVPSSALSCRSSSTAPARPTVHAPHASSVSTAPAGFLRGVIAGKAAEQPDDAAEIEELFRSVVVVRGTTPMPPRDLIPLHMPKSTQTAV